MTQLQLTFLGWAATAMLAVWVAHRHDRMAKAARVLEAKWILSENRVAQLTAIVGELPRRGKGGRFVRRD